ncbi:MAG TPA: hypothetical protein VFB62_17460, partial [Polyangiaceae bacterium]|nr:hypothetical protein [Polyangiaceae bacterium]
MSAVHEAPATGPTRRSAEPEAAPAEPTAALRLDRVAAWWHRHDTLVYAAFAAACTLYAASLFYGYMMVQTGGVWSAPLDDVFIHFDYARSFARGYPFQWSEGNGYSSGNTSLLYPAVLAFGYWIGFRDLLLMVWAAAVAVASIFAFLVFAGTIATESGHRWMRFFFPPAVLSIGALDWTLFSGMENAFHLGIWGLCLALVLQHRRAWLCGAACALLVATRPESVVCVAAFAIYTAWHARRQGLRRSAQLLIAVGAPGAVLLVLHGVANLLFTGEWSANGAIAKLFLNNPFMSAADMWERYVSLLSYIVPRLTQHHFSQHVPFGWLIPLVALGPLFSRRLRPFGVLLWVQILGWLLLVSLNNQVRWHNERYAMPAVAWLLVLAALGIGALLAAAVDTERRMTLWRVPAAIALVALYWTMQAPRFQDQVWFFGRASRNILDQHVTAGRLLKDLGVRRVLVGDAGALIYASDRPGLDLIGLGGYHAYPFARSTVHGLGASLELIERMPESERPDVMAIYPSWWGDLPHLFGEHLASVPVRGNVICGGPEKVLYKADWSSMDRAGVPRSLRKGERVTDELDVG